jgi:hypothetical protein
MPRLIRGFAYEGKWKLCPLLTYDLQKGANVRSIQFEMIFFYRLQPCADRRREINDALCRSRLNLGSHLKDPRSPVGSSALSLPSERAPDAITLSIRIRQLSLSTDCKSYLGIFWKMSLLWCNIACVQKDISRCGSEAVERRRACSPSPCLSQCYWAASPVCSYSASPL